MGQRRNEIAVLRSRGSTTGSAGRHGRSWKRCCWVWSACSSARLSPRWWQVSSAERRSFLDFSADVRSRSSSDSLNVAALRIGRGRGGADRYGPADRRGRPNTPSSPTNRTAPARREDPGGSALYLDLLLLIPAGYGMYLLQRQERLGRPVSSALSADPFQNPLLLLVPALGIFAVTLLIIRLLPMLMSGVAWLASQTRSVGLLMAARYLSRSTSGYTAPVDPAGDDPQPFDLHRHPGANPRPPHARPDFLQGRRGRARDRVRRAAGRLGRFAGRFAFHPGTGSRDWRRDRRCSGALVLPAGLRASQGPGR